VQLGSSHGLPAIRPGSIAVRNDAVRNRRLLLAWAAQKDDDKAIADFSAVVRLAPNNANAYARRAAAYQHKKSYDEAVADFTQALRFDSSVASTNNNAAWLMATCSEERFRDGRKAIDLATKACELSDWKSADRLDALAAAYAETGDFDAAIQWQSKALEMNPSDAEVIKGMKERLALYKDHHPYREQ
jgi:tetratricopeptide (TPR) repeat protein